MSKVRLTKLLYVTSKPSACPSAHHQEPPKSWKTSSDPPEVTGSVTACDRTDDGAVFPCHESLFK